MSEQAEQKKRRGRPPMSREDRKGGNLTFRVRDGMREWLEISAKARGVSISEEVEKRLEQSRQQAADAVMDTALRMATANCMVVQDLTGRTIAEDAYTRTACAKAAATAIELVGGIAGQDTPETRAFLQFDAEAFGQVVGIFTKALLDGAPEDATNGLRQMLETMTESRRAEIEASRRRQAQLLARLLREGTPSDPATPDEIAGMVPAPGQLPPSIGDRALFDDATSGLPLVKAEREAALKAKAEKPALAPGRRSKAKAES